MGWEVWSKWKWGKEEEELSDWRRRRRRRRKKKIGRYPMGPTKRGFKLLKQNVLILLNREGPREFDCPRFVIESTDQIWNMYRGIFKQ